MENLEDFQEIQKLDVPLRSSTIHDDSDGLEMIDVDSPSEDETIGIQEKRPSSSSPSKMK